MVDEKQERVFVGARLEQRRAKWDLVGEIESMCRCRGEVVLGRDSAQRRGCRWQDVLMWSAVGINEERAQAFVASDYVAERLFERSDVECPFQPDADRNVVIRVRSLELVQEPEAGLGEGERQLRRPLLRRKRQASLGEGVQGAGQVAEHWRIKDGADRQFASEPDTDAGGESGGHERVAAQVEEVVLQADAFQAQDLAHEIAE